MSDTTTTTINNTTSTTTSSNTTINTSKILRSKSLLYFLDKNINDLIQKERIQQEADKQASAAGNALGLPLFSTFNFTSLFGSKKNENVVQKAATTTGTSTTATSAIGGKYGSSTASTTIHQQQEYSSSSMEEYMAELKYIAWLPVLTTTPHTCMPWPTVTSSSTTSSSATDTTTVPYSSTTSAAPSSNTTATATTKTSPTMPLNPTTTTTTLSLTAAPIDTYPLSSAWLVSATKRLVEVPVHSPALRRLLGWEEAVDVQVIAIQLRELSKQYLTLYPTSGNSNSSDSSSDYVNTTTTNTTAVEQSSSSSSSMEEIQSLRETITGLIPQLYQRLNKAVMHDSTTISSGTSGRYSGSSYDSTTTSTTTTTAAVAQQSILSLLQNSAWIWVGETFVPIDRVALHTGVSATPYLYQLPQDLQVYSALLRAFQVKLRFTNSDYIEVLKQMAIETGAINTTSTSTSGSTSTSNNNTKTTSTTPAVSNNVRVLSDTHLDICINLATLLSTDTTTTPLSTYIIYLPDNQGRLALSEQLINDDVPWLSGPEYISIRYGCRFIHPHISTKVATVLGVKSLRLTLLNKTLDQNIFTLSNNNTNTTTSNTTTNSNSINIENYGQTESITNRLKTILDMYPDGNPIFTELIQNADDAGATEIKILLDKNTYNTVSLLDSKMSELQGPALLFYNNSIFTEKDFENLAKIGQGSKLSKIDSTGRFGLGFNSIYHITDTPSFVSNDSIIILDPHCSYIPGAKQKQPGIRIKYTNTTLSTTFYDQFLPYQFFQCNMNTNYPNTLFRFPLRTLKQSKTSEISKRSYNTIEMETNLHQLSTQLQNILLFLRNIKKIEIYICEENSQNPVLYYSAKKSENNIKLINNQSLLTYFHKNRGSEGGTNSSTNSSINTSMNSNIEYSRDGFYKKLLGTADEMLPRVLSEVHIEIVGYTYSSDTSSSSSSTTNVITDSNTSTNNTSSSSNDNTQQNTTTLIDTETTTELTINPVQTAVQSIKTQVSCMDYILCTGLCGGRAKQMACLDSLRHYKLIPLGSVAVCIHSSSGGSSTTSSVDSTNSSSTSSNTSLSPYPTLQGLAYCYLPLPVHTQLPVHCNAYFELSSNRRDIWKGADTTGEAKMRSG